MNKLIISYDLSKPGRDYPSLTNAIKLYGTYANVTESTWIIRTPYSASEVRDNLKQHIDTNDKLIVLSYGGWWAGTLSLGQSTINWLRDVL